MLKEMNPNLWLSLEHYHGKLVETGSPLILCTLLPTHWRSNKRLACTFKVITLDPDIPNGTEVVVTAGNQINDHAELYNNTALIKNSIAEFHDLRFVGDGSGRGKLFSITITIRTSMVSAMPDQIAIYSNAIKISKDGPRKPRKKRGKHFA